MPTVRDMGSRVVFALSRRRARRPNEGLQEWWWMRRNLWYLTFRAILT